VTLPVHDGTAKPKDNLDVRRFFTILSFSRDMSGIMTKREKQSFSHMPEHHPLLDLTP
jgi:hypothetical protein